MLLLSTGGPNRDRTDDLIVANDTLSQLSYWPNVYLFNNRNMIFSILYSNLRPTTSFTGKEKAIP